MTHKMKKIDIRNNKAFGRVISFTIPPYRQILCVKFFNAYSQI